MHHHHLRQPLCARRLDAYKVALQLQQYLQPLVDRMQRTKSTHEHAQQLLRSLPSITNNLCEAMRRTGGDRPHLLTVALGSADEIRSTIDSVVITGAMTPEQAAHADGLADRYCAMVFRLRQRCG